MLLVLKFDCLRSASPYASNIAHATVCFHSYHRDIGGLRKVSCDRMGCGRCWAAEARYQEAVDAV